jgi:hypothetical protein
MHWICSVPAALGRVLVRGGEMLGGWRWLGRAAVYALIFATMWGLDALVIRGRSWSDSLGAAVGLMIVIVPFTELKVWLRRRRASQDNC